jgi:GrpB-like predicted nucleotidyltransferase (UPF0157 family)
METLEQRIQRILREDVAIIPYDPRWSELFRRERDHLRACLPGDLLGHVEHFGSTAVPGLAAKPVVDLLVEVTDLQAARTRIAPRAGGPLSRPEAGAWEVEQRRPRYEQCRRETSTMTASSAH